MEVRPTNDSDSSPPGVDAHAWGAFENRIRARRHAALLAAIDRAIAAEDTSTARRVIQEARQLADDAPKTSPHADVRVSPCAFCAVPTRQQDMAWRVVTAVMAAVFGAVVVAAII